MLRTLSPLFALLFALPFWACSTVSVSSDFDPGTDFGTLSTWVWRSDRAPDGVDDLTHGRVRAAVEAALPARGLRRAQAGESPDVRVEYHASVRERIQTSPSSATMGYGWRHGYAAIEPTEISTYDEGTLVLDLVAAADDTLLWRGVAKGAVSDDRSPQEREARIREAVEAILERYPPQR